MKLKANEIIFGKQYQSSFGQQNQSEENSTQKFWEVFNRLQMKTLLA
jgi:hypothetical protein